MALASSRRCRFSSLCGTLPAELGSSSHSRCLFGAIGSPNFVLLLTSHALHTRWDTRGTPVVIGRRSRVRLLHQGWWWALGELVGRIWTVLENRSYLGRRGRSAAIGRHRGYTSRRSIVGTRGRRWRIRGLRSIVRICDSVGRGLGRELAIVPGLEDVVEAVQLPGKLNLVAELHAGTWEMVSCDVEALVVVLDSALVVPVAVGLQHGVGQEEMEDEAPPSDRTAATAEVLADSAGSLQDDECSQAEAAAVAEAGEELEPEHPTEVLVGH